MKRSNWAGLVATSLLAVTTLGGCSDDAPPANAGGTANAAGTPATTAGTGTGGTPAAGGSATAGTSPMTGTKLDPPNSYTYLTGADAAANATAAPAAYSSAATACNSCHGANGEGTNLIAPEIRHVSATYANWVIRNGRGFMSKFDTSMLSDADMQSIIAWMDSMPKPATGDSLYKDFCGNCHGPTTGSGGAVPVKVTGLTMTQVTNAVRGGFGTDPSYRTAFMPKFEVAALSDAELALIQTFLGSTP